MNRLIKLLRDDATLVINRVDLQCLFGKHIIITGASGLVGINILSALVEFCNKNGNRKIPTITVVVYSKTTEIFDELTKYNNIQVKSGDISDEKFVNSLDEADYIIHAAGYGQPNKFIQDKIKTVSINTVATMHLMRKLKTSGKFLFVSTSEVYSGSKPPYKEDVMGTTSPQHPRACYIEGKRCGEAICTIYKEQGYDIKIARLSLAYGPGTKKGDARVLNQFIENGFSGDINLLDTGEATRTYCYIVDAVEMLLQILLNGKNLVYNVGGVSKIKIRELAHMIAELTNSRVNLGKKPIRGSPDNVCLDIANTLIEFPKKFTDLEDGLKKTIKYQKILYEK